ncbi:MAG: 3'(2'), 5'-bisphosphate nucleotidase, partial [Gammaproteobacteria bacterium]
MPELNSYQELLPACIDIAREAGDKIMEIYKTDFEITDKSDNSPLTTADLAANQVITDGL